MPLGLSCIRLRRAVPALLLGMALLMAAGCGGNDDEPISLQQLEQGGSDEQSPSVVAGLATKNTSRIWGPDSAEVAAGVALTAFPSQSDQDRPAVVALVDRSRWAAAASAAVLMHGPVRAPLLLTDASKVPRATKAALETLQPKGSPQAQNAQVIRIGEAPAPRGLRGMVIAGRDDFELAAAIDAFAESASGKPARRVVVAPIEQQAFALPAAGWAAKSGDPLLFVRQNDVPEATRAALARHGRPAIYLLGPANAVSERVFDELRTLGSRVTRIDAESPVSGAIAFARYRQHGFGWGVTDPGHGLVLANLHRPLDVAVAAPLSASGTYGPLLLLDQANQLPPDVEQYLLDIQPGYRADPARGVYNHAWLLGDLTAINLAVQAKVDLLLEIQRVEIPESQGQPPGSQGQQAPGSGTPD